MRLKDFIRDQFKPQLEERRCLVICDAEGRYRECPAEPGSGARAFIDAGECIITARERAPGERLRMARLGQSKQQRQRFTCLPAPKPESDEEKCRDPFQNFTLGGAAFPEGDGDISQVLEHLA